MKNMTHQSYLTWSVGTNYLLEYLCAESQNLNSMDFRHKDKKTETHEVMFVWIWTNRGDSHKIRLIFQIFPWSKNKCWNVGWKLFNVLQCTWFTNKKQVFCFEEVSCFTICLEGMASNFHQSVSSHQLYLSKNVLISIIGQSNCISCGPSFKGHKQINEKIMSMKKWRIIVK